MKAIQDTKKEGLGKGEAVKVARLELLNSSARSDVVYTVADDGVSAVASYENSRGFLCACGFRGKSMKAAFAYRFDTIETRDKYQSDWLAQVNAAAALKQERVQERKKPHTLAVSDVLVSSWGYDQTNVDFYEVVAVRGSVIDIVELRQTREHTGNMQGTCVPRKGDHKGEIIKGKRPNGQNAVRIDACSVAVPWDGKPSNWTSWA